MGKNGKLIIISAPSGCGKSTIIGEIIDDPNLKLSFSVSATNRSPRQGEQDGVNYYFLTDDEFRQAIDNDELVEYEEVYPGRFYGTLKKEIDRICRSGRNVILDIDVKGAVNVKNQFKDDSLSVFIKPPSIDVLRQRLTSRGTEDAEAINQRVGKAEFELSYADKFDKCVVNDVLADAVSEVRSILTEFIEK